MLGGFAVQSYPERWRADIYVCVSDTTLAIIASVLTSSWMEFSMNHPGFIIRRKVKAQEKILNG